jgi:hypothetical protein
LAAITAATEVGRLRELASGADLSSVLERYARIELLAGFIAQLNGDQLPPPARLVGGRR